MFQENSLLPVLDWCYERALQGVPDAGMESVQELADYYLNDSGTLKRKIENMCDYQVYKCTTTGFLTSLGGVVTLPIAVPANITTVLWVQVRMIAAVAYMCGYDIKDDRVKTLVYAALLGNACSDVLKKCGIKISEKLTQTLIKSISKEIIKEINKNVGFRLVTKFGEKGLINLGKLIPVISGFVGAGFEYVSTRVIAKIAIKMFYYQNLQDA